MIERKWMVLRLDTDGVTIVESSNSQHRAQLQAWGFERRYPGCFYVIKFGYPWEA